MKTYIEIAEKKAGTQIKLAEILNISDAYIRNAKKGRSGLPDAICIKLADYIGVERLEVIAASNLVTEKDEERRKIFESCLSWFVVVIFASVLTVMTPSPAEASKYQDVTVQEVKTVYIMLYYGRKL